MLRQIHRLALHLLPSNIRRKHMTSMDALFARELDRAAERGALVTLVTAARGIGDVVVRAGYEHLRRARGAIYRRYHMPETDGSLTTIPAALDLLRRHAVSFSVTFLALTALLVTRYATASLSSASLHGGSMTEAVLLAIPFTAAMTIPMAVFIAVLLDFQRLGASGVLTTARRVPHGIRRLTVPVLATGCLAAALSLVVTTGVLPHANKRLNTLLRGESTTRSSRTMTVGELREASRLAVTAATPDATERAAEFQVEVQKKFALPAACVVLSLLGMAIALRFPRGGRWFLVVASMVAFSVYYVTLMTGEALADRGTIPPVVAMWGTNVFLLMLALAGIWSGRGAVTPSDSIPMTAGA